MMPNLRWILGLVVPNRCYAKLEELMKALEEEELIAAEPEEEGS